MQRDMEASRRQMDSPGVADRDRRRITKPAPASRFPKPIPRNSAAYPSIQKPQAVRYDDYNPQPNPTSSQQPYLPPKPPKQQLGEPPFHEVEPPALPAKSTPPTDDPDMANLKTSSSYTFRPSAYLENGKPLRTVFLPPTLRERFLAIAAPNTRNNLETCGVLCGTLISNALFISHLVIPEQESTSDTCETVNESALFDFCEREDVMVLGWIHTHPTQTCFMSSRDLHTHSGYQIMMAESIAIVCAPTKTPS